MNKILLLSVLTFIFSAQFTLAHKHNFEILPATGHTASFGCYTYACQSGTPIEYRIGSAVAGVVIGSLATSQPTWSDFMWESLIIGGTAYATTTLGSAACEMYKDGNIYRKSTKQHLIPACIVAAIVARPMWNSLSPIPLALAKTIWNFKIK